MPITEAIIRDLASAQSFERGEDYFFTGAVYELQKRGNTLIAEVTGSSYEPYKVTIELEAGEVSSMVCTCPYEWSGACKHIVAVLLTYLRQPERVIERPPVAQLLAKLGEAELRALLTELLTSETHLIDWVETKLALKPIPAASLAETKEANDMSRPPTPQPAPIDPAPFRRQVRQILRTPSGPDYYAAAYGIARQISHLLDQVQPYLEVSDGRNALLILEAIVEPYVDAWYEYDDSDGELGSVFDEIGPLVTEAILSADLSQDERQAWAAKLTEWQGEIEDYGIDSAFDPAIAAIQLGWDYPPLQKVLQGHISKTGTWEGEAPWYADDLAVARLRVLACQGRTTEYLYLAEAEGQTALYLTMLVKLGRIEEAVNYAREHMATTDEALALAQALREHNQPSEALKIAEHGLKLHGETLPLARWLRDFATEVFEPDIALRAARVAFSGSFTLEDYQTAKVVAGKEWPSLRLELLGQLEAARFAYEEIDIYLYEGMTDKAVSAVDSQSYVDYYTLERVVDAAWQIHPDWAIQQCCKQAERIMDGGQSKYYHHAIHWLERARRAYLGSNQAPAWNSYLEGLIRKHTRKYSLRPQLERLRYNDK